MANHISAIKRARQNEKRAKRNQAIQSTTKTLVKKALEAIRQAKSKEEGLKALTMGERVLRKAASKKVIPSERASRKISRLTHALNAKFTQAQ